MPERETYEKAREGAAGRQPVTDPVRDLRLRYGRTFTVCETCGEAWEPYAVYHTTGEYRRLDRGYTRHCGPVAITNALLTLDGRYRFMKERPSPSDALFRRIARIGRRGKGIFPYYLNMDLLRHFGGTFDAAAGAYLRASFRALADAGTPGRPGRPRASVSVLLPAWPFLLLRALHRGNLLYLQLHGHPCYRSHHVIAYGAVLLRERGGRRKRLYLKCADGWSGAPRYIAAEDLRLSAYREVRVQNV